METLDRARAYTAAVPGAISGSRGHDQTFALANALTWGFALDDQTALALLLEWNARCQPTWKERDLRRKILESRKASHQKPFGHLLTAGERSRTFRTPQVAPPAQKSVWKIKRRPTEKQPSQEVDAPEIPPEDDGMVWVPGCATRRPVEIEMADADWRALEASGFASEPLVQMAAWMFGSGCTVLDTGEATPCA